MRVLSIEAAAKINWRLAVTGRRPDGYHLLSGLMQSISLTDTLRLRESAADQCRVVSGPDVAVQQNLALTAWLLLKRELGLAQCLQIEIEKRIPLAAGLGGGSADAAAVLTGANTLFELGLDLAELCRFAQKLGADVPFCLRGGLALAQGVGELLTPLKAPPALPLLLVNPGVAVPTARVFAHYRESGQAFAAARQEEQCCAALAQALAAGDIPAIQALSANDLADSARQLYPSIARLERRMLEAGLTPLLCGSGATLFAVAQSAADLERAQQQLADAPWSAVVETNNR